jgi:hypothetical protein
MTHEEVRCGIFSDCQSTRSTGELYKQQVSEAVTRTEKERIPEIVVPLRSEGQ